MTTLREFLDGLPLDYKGFDKKKATCTYRVGVGVFIERGEKKLGIACVMEDTEAKRLYWNLTRTKS